jgi:hypothetical protein
MAQVRPPMSQVRPQMAQMHRSEGAQVTTPADRRCADSAMADPAYLRPAESLQNDHAGVAGARDRGVGP